MNQEKGNFITRFLDRIDTLIPEDPVTGEARRIRLGAELLKGQSGSGVSRKDIPKVLGILADKDGKGLVVERSPDQVSATIKGEKVAVWGIDQTGELRVSFGGEESVVHDPSGVGDILIRRMAALDKKENLG